MGVAESKEVERAPTPLNVVVDKELESSEDELEIINILSNVTAPESTEDEDDDEEAEYATLELSHPVSKATMEESSDIYSEITKYSASFWSFVGTNEMTGTSNGSNGHVSKSQIESLLEGSAENFDLYELSRSLTAQMDSLVRGLASQSDDRPTYSSMFDQLSEALSSSAKYKVVLPTALTIALKKEFLRTIQEDLPIQITEIRIAESFTEGSGALFSLVESITCISSAILEPEIENVIAKPSRTIIWQSEASLLIRFGQSKQLPIVVIDPEGVPSEEDYLSVCALFQEYRTKPCFELKVPSENEVTTNAQVVVQSLRVWYEVVNLSLFVRLNDSLLDLYDEDVLYTLPVPVFEEHLLIQWDFVHKYSNVSGRIVTDMNDITLSFFRCIFEHLTMVLDCDAVFVYVRDLLQFIYTANVLNEVSGTVYGGGIVSVLRYLNHHLPEEKHRLLLRTDIAAAVSSSSSFMLGSPTSNGSSKSSSQNNGIGQKCYHAEFLPQDDSRPLLQSLGQIVLQSSGSNGNGSGYYYCSYKYEPVVQSRQELSASSLKIRWKDLLTADFH